MEDRRATVTDTRRSVGSSTGSVGTVQARDELARVGADMGDFVGDVLSSVVCGAACTAVVTEGGKLFTAGLGINGQLGHVSRKDFLEFTEVKALGEIKVKTCVFGSSHSVALSEDGQVFTWGGGLGGALGRGGLDDELEPAKVEEELSNTKMDARGLPVVTCRRVQAIAAAEDYVLVLVEDGKLFCWGNAAGVLVPARELEGELDGRRVVKLFSGYSSAQHRAVITEEEIVILQGEETSVQRLFTWGRGDEGQLGNGRDRVLDSNHTNASAPELITRGLAEGESISAVSLGGFHTLVLTSSGQVYACGRGSEGQLGPRFFSQGDTRQVPGHVLHPVGGVLLDACIIQVSAGLHTSAALSDNGRVWLWGLESANNQWEEQRVFDWGDGCPNAWIPLEVKGLKGPANHFSCGRAHYAVLCEHDIMTWGEGTFGQLAHGNRAHMSHPRSSPVPLREST